MFQQIQGIWRASIRFALLAVTHTNRVARPLVFKTINNSLTGLSGITRRRKRLVSVVVDFGAVLFSLWLAYSLRLDTPLTSFQAVWHYFLLLPPLTIASLWVFGVYKWVVRSVNSSLVRQVLIGVGCSAAILAVLHYSLPQFSTYSRSVVLIYPFLLAPILLSYRFAWKFLKGADDSRSIDSTVVAIYGAGMGGEKVVSLMRSDASMHPALFIDDDPYLQGKTVAGLPVFKPNTDTLEDLVSDYGVDQVVVAISEIVSEAHAEVIQKLRLLNIPVKTIPTISEMVNRRPVSTADIREVSVGDILGRNQVPPDEMLLGKQVVGQSVMVTGAGGSIGSELCRQVFRIGAEKLIVVDNSEYNLYKIGQELLAKKANSGNKASANTQLEVVLCSVTNEKKVREIIRNNSVTTIFHAAAYKHVPIVQDDPDEAVRVNVFGTLALVEAAIAEQVRSFVQISTDKAVRPSNYMGATKRIAEKLLLERAARHSGTSISMVRFGNVLNSSGSVVPKFNEQIAKGGPVTVTHPEVTRYFMTIPEAAQLVLQAASMSNGGEVFVLDMGEPVKIVDLAEAMIHLQGKQPVYGSVTDDTPANAIKIDIVGMRPGEKMHEELFYRDTCEETLVPKIMVDTAAQVLSPDFPDGMSRLNDALKKRDLKTLCDIISELGDMPEAAQVTAGELQLENR